MQQRKKRRFKFSRLYKLNSVRNKSFKITVLYFILGSIWIVFSDLAANNIANNGGATMLNITKGLIYVAVTSIIIYKLTYSSFAKLRISERQLLENQRIFKTVFEQAPIGISIVNNYYFMAAMNNEFERILCRPKEELASLSWIDITHPDDLESDMELFRKFKEGEIEGYSMEKRFIKPDGQYIWIYMVIANINISDNSKSKNHLCIIQDINEKKIAEQSLFESERSKSILLSNMPGIAYRCKIKEGKLVTEFLSEGCYELTGYKPESLLFGNGNVMYGDLILDKHKKFTENEWRSAVERKVPFRYEYQILSASGEIKWVMEIGQGIYDKDGNAEAIEGIIIDITESKKGLEQIEYLNNHDHLTGLFNRKYYETEKLHLDFYAYLPISIIMADINGVRLINNTFGHAEGDRLILETAKILQSCCRNSDLLARTGGDDFIIIMPKTTYEEANETIICIKEKCKKYNNEISNRENYINISTGFATKNNKEESIEEIEKEANEYMLKQKIFEHKSHHYAVLSSIMATMYARSQETEEHALRIAEIGRKIAGKLGLNKQQSDELYLYSILHDIGKVSIDDRILNKQGKLTEREWNIMKTHPEIGHRIAMSVPELESISEYILTHHERWDGEGYPRGLKEEEIPLLSRILAVADAYDAMTEGRVYKKAVSNEEAIEEIRKNAGRQFDPDIVKIFMEIMEK